MIRRVRCFGLLILLSLCTIMVFLVQLHSAPSTNVQSATERSLLISMVTTEREEVCWWSTASVNDRRSVFCNVTDNSVEELCRCRDPAPIDVQLTPLPVNHVANTPVAIIATNRVNCLYRTLYALLSANGANRSLITVFLDGQFPAPIALANLFQVQSFYHQFPERQVTKIKKIEMAAMKYRIDQHYRLSLTTVFDLYPHAQEAIILEDDLEVSRDFFSYFSQTIYLLREDPSLYCISAWNDFSYRYASQDPGQLYRVDTMPGLGWLLTRRLYKEELETKWPNKSEPLTWDGWMREPPQRKGRECVMPDVCRTFHFSLGAHINKYQQQRHFDVHSFYTGEEMVELNTTELFKDEYEEQVATVISQAQLFIHKPNVPLCSTQHFVEKSQYYVVYIKSNATLKLVMRCFRLWDLDYRPGHNNMWRFWSDEKHILVIQCPESKYCRFKPSNVHPREDHMVIPGVHMSHGALYALIIILSAFCLPVFITLCLCICDHDR